MSKVFKFNQHVCGEDYDRWKAYIESKEPAAIVLPDFIRVEEAVLQ